MRLESFSENAGQSGVFRMSVPGTNFMGTCMSSDTSSIDDLMHRAVQGEQQAVADLFERHREQLVRMVRIRLDPRLQGRLDPADVVQEAFLDVRRRFAEYADNPKVTLLVWLRAITGQRLVDLYRFHLGARVRDARREVSLYRGALPQASSASLAAQLLGRLTSPSQVAVRAETKLRVQEALNTMDEIDREILCMRHFEFLTNSETAEALGLKPAAASNRYIRALRRLKDVLSDVAGFTDEVLE